MEWTLFWCLVLLSLRGHYLSVIGSPLVTHTQGRIHRGSTSNIVHMKRIGYEILRLSDLSDGDAVSSQEHVNYHGIGLRQALRKFCLLAVEAIRGTKRSVDTMNTGRMCIYNNRDKIYPHGNSYATWRGLSTWSDWPSNTNEHVHARVVKPDYKNKR